MILGDHYFSGFFILRDGLAECLRNPANVETWNQLVMHYEHPGWLYGADRQCEFIFGPGYQLCPYTVKFCALFELIVDSRAHLLLSYVV